MSKSTQTGKMVGLPAVDFDLLDHEGVRRTLADDRGSWVWLMLHRHLG